MGGPSYLPGTNWEWVIWLSLVICGAFVGRTFVVFAYHQGQRWSGGEG